MDLKKTTAKAAIAGAMGVGALACAAGLAHADTPPIPGVPGNAVSPGPGGQLPPGPGGQLPPGLGGQLPPGPGGQLPPGSGGPIPGQVPERDDNRGQAPDRDNWGQWGDRDDHNPGQWGDRDDHAPGQPGGIAPWGRQ